MLQSVMARSNPVCGRHRIAGAYTIRNALQVGHVLWFISCRIVVETGIGFRCARRDEHRYDP
jgi:hypothetical protein